MKIISSFNTTYQSKTKIFPIVSYNVQDHKQEVKEAYLFNKHEEDCDIVTFKIMTQSHTILE